ncbi:hypothetical protein PINS_up020082 [Pythium insidiosum]|nr:hypothetical protein PINS_up020082 [Pythium insidiosum]
MRDLAAQYRLVELQREELKIQCKVDDYEQWGAPALDPNGYQAKEKTQRQTAHSQRGSIFWALVERKPSDTGSFGDDDDIQDDGMVAGVDAIVCHCESHMFDCAFRKANGEIIEGYSHHIGSVFTLPAHRGKGLARFFLTGVAQRMQKKKCTIASVLYSDIGPTFYDKLGWRLHPSDMVVLDSSASKNMEEPSALMTDFVLDDAFDKFLATDNERLKKEMQSAKYEGREVFAPLPSRDSIDWQFCLGVFYARHRGFPRFPSRCGVKIDADAFVVWCHNLKESTLYIVHARFPSSAPARTVQLLRSALTEARAFGLSSVKIWDPCGAVLDQLVSSDLDLVKTTREDSLSSLLIFPQHRTGSPTEPLPVWLNNEKLAWV